MIVDHIRNREKYYCLGEDFKAALDFFATVSDAPFEQADIKIENSGVIVKVRPMATKKMADCAFEAHREYADIHFVAYGKERIGYADVENLKLVQYDSEKDVAFLEGEGDLVTLDKGYFMITLTDDAHMPCVCADEPKPLGKMIAKIKV